MAAFVLSLGKQVPSKEFPNRDTVVEGVMTNATINWMKAFPRTP